MNNKDTDFTGKEKQKTGRKQLQISPKKKCPDEVVSDKKFISNRKVTVQKKSTPILRNITIEPHNNHHTLEEFWSSCSALENDQSTS